MALSLGSIGGLLVIALIGVGFCWLYSTKKDLYWWAIIPGLSAFTVLAAVLSEFIIGTDPKNDWINVLVIGAGTAIIAAVLKRQMARFVLVAVSAITFIVGIAMAPLAVLWKGVLIVALIVAAAFILWRGDVLKSR